MEWRVNGLEHSGKSDLGSSTLFFAAIVLPLLFFLLTLTIDIQSLMRRRVEIQTTLDEAGLRGYRFANSAVAVSDGGSKAAHDYLSLFPMIAEMSTIKEGRDFIDIVYRGSIPLNFGALFLRFFGEANPETRLPLAVATRVRGSVFDTVLAVDRSYYLAPDPLSNAGAAWSPLSSPMFEDVFPVSIPSGGGIVTMDPAIATQQCFNPVFSELKATAASIYSALQAFSLNSTGVIFFPGGHEASNTLRPLARSEKPDMNFNEMDSRGSDDEYFNINSSIFPREIIESRFCAAVAERSSDGALMFPDRRNSLSPAGGKSFMIRDLDWQYDLDYDPELEASEVFWSRSVQSNPMLKREPSTPEVLDNALAVVLAENIRTDRGGLANRALRSIVVLTGDVPRLGGMRFPENGRNDVTEGLRATFANYRALVKRWEARAKVGGDPLSLRIFYLLYHNPLTGLDIENRLESLKAFFDEESRIDGVLSDSFRIHLFASDDAERLFRNIGGAMTLMRKSGVISR